MGIDVAINSKEDPEGLQREVDKLGRGGLPVIFEATGARGPLMQAADLIGERGRLVMISQVHGEALPPIDGLQGKLPTQSIFIVKITVDAPRRADASAASHPA
mgnify:CR=1 FL=1